jgi:D-sedoheptulose 7-phosphate isomerase
MKSKYIDAVKNHFQTSSRVKLATMELLSDSIVNAADLLANSFKQGGKLMLCGNGGSAADAQHIAAEFTSLLRLDFVRPGLPALALGAETSYLTARSNDFGFNGVYSRLVETLGNHGDVLIGISTSGNSKNVVEALEVARNKNIKTICMTGKGGGLMASLADVHLPVESDRTPFIQEAHITIGHIICQLVEDKVFTLGVL